MPKPILITGCGSSGTKYISCVLKRGGVSVGHEHMGLHGMSSWYAAVGLARVRPPFNGTPYNQFKNVFGEEPLVLHQIRHPLKMISTCQRYSVPSWRYICNFVPEINIKQPLVLRCMLYWYHWTRLADILAERRYRIEEFPDIFEEWCEWIGWPELIKKKMRMLAQPRNTNSRIGKYKPLTWQALEDMDGALAREIQKKGRKYGYEIQEL